MKLVYSGSPLDDMIAGFFKFKLSWSLIFSLCLIAVLIVFAIIIGVKARRADPLAKPKGLLNIVEYFVSWLDDWTARTMGFKSDAWPGYFMGLFVYLFLAFEWSLTGLPSLVDFIIIPLSLSLIMFILIQATALKYQKGQYFHRYIEPVPFWLPINLITMWTPILSTTLRMFGNALSGSIIIAIVNWALKNVSTALFSFLGSPGAIILGPIPIAVLNVYFGLFSGLIQTLVFASLNAVWIGQEVPLDQIMGSEKQLLRPENN